MSKEIAMHPAYWLVNSFCGIKLTEGSRTHVRHTESNFSRNEVRWFICEPLNAATIEYI